VSALRAIQSDFQDYILNHSDADADAAAVAGPPPAIAAAVREQSGLDAAARLAIYHRAYRSRLRQALCEAYDKTWSYLGDELFAELADSYLAAHPSRHPNLRWFGAGFAAHAALALPDYPYIAELAALEWALGLAFDADAAAPLGRADLAALAPQAWGELVFGLHPSVQLLAMEWNAAALWQALAADAAPPAAVQLESAMVWLIWRSAGQPHFRSLPALEAQALRQIARGASFGEVCAAAGDDYAMAMLAGYLQNWLAQGVLKGARAASCGNLASAIAAV
jgi:hypothetical protein